MTIHTKKSAASLLLISVTTLDRWIKAGRIKVTRPGGPGGNIRILQSEIDRITNIDQEVRA